MALDLYNLTKKTTNKNISDYKWTIFGAYGSGKSTLATGLFNALDGDSVTFGFEERFNGIEGIRVVPIRTWKEAKDYLKQLKKGVKDHDGELPFKSIVLDPVGVAGDMCTKYICNREGVDEIGDIGYGGGYAMLKTEFEAYVDDLRNLGFKVNFVSHGKLETVKPPRGEEYNIFTPDVPKKLIYKTQGEADFIVYLTVVREVDKKTGKSSAKRRLYFQNYADYSLKTPIKGMPDYIEYDEVEEGVEKIIEAFNTAVGLKNEEHVKSKEKKTPEVGKIEPGVVENEEEESSKDIRQRAAEIREKNLRKNGGTYTPLKMKKLLEEMLGTYKIDECEDDEAILSFIVKMTETEEAAQKLR